MRIRSVLVLVCLAWTQVQGQDTLTITCKDSVVSLIKLSPQSRSVVLQNIGACDSFYVMTGQKYQLIQRDLRACKSFVELYKFYRDEVKKGDKEVAVIVDGYENIIKTKDDAYNKLMEEYDVLNQLLDTSIAQTGSAVDLGRKSLQSLDASLQTIEKSNDQLRTDLKDLKKINRKNKWQFGIGGLIVGVLVGFIIAR